MFGKPLFGAPLKWRQRQRLNTVLGVTFLGCMALNMALLVWPLDGGSLVQQHAPSSHAVLNLSVDTSAIASPVEDRQEKLQAKPLLKGVPVFLKDGSLPQVMLPRDAFDKRERGFILRLSDVAEQYQPQDHKEEGSGDAVKQHTGGKLLGGTRIIQDGTQAQQPQPLLAKHKDSKNAKPQASGRVMDDDTADDDFVGPPVRLAPPSIDALVSGLSEEQRKIEIAERTPAEQKQKAESKDRKPGIPSVEEGNVQGKGKMAAPSEGQSCEVYLEAVDAYAYSRDYANQPLLIERNKGPENFRELESCAVPCRFASGVTGRYDASLEDKTSWPRVRDLTAVSPGKLEEEIKSAGADDVIMAPDLNAHVSTLPLSWGDHGRLMGPPIVPVAKKADAIAAFLPACKAGSLMEQVLSAMLKLDTLTVRSFGQCLPNQAKGPLASEVLPQVKFALLSGEGGGRAAVLQNFFQTLEAGTVPIVIGGADIKALSPSPSSFLSVSSAAAVPSLLQQTEGPSDEFLAIMDAGSTPTECRLCTLLADRQRAKEKADKPRDRPCACRDRDHKGAERVVHHVYFRERGRFEFRSLFLEEPLTLARVTDSVRLTLGQEYDYTPLWTSVRPSYRKRLADGSWDRSHHPLRVYVIQPAGQGEGWQSDEAVRQWVRQHPCGELEVVLV